jgi:outer membrane immunogenic protein
MKKNYLKHIMCLSVALGGIAAASPAMANPSDGNSDGYNYEPTGNWAGPYIGGFAGGTWSDFSQHAGSDSDLMYGGNIGNNWQRGRIVMGLEGDFSKFNNHVGGGGTKFDEDWMATARARLGYSMGRFLPYATGGLAMTDTVYKVSGIGSSENVQPGYAVGGGVDTMLTDHWFGRAEYLYTDVPNDSATINNVTVRGGSGNHTGRVGVGYKF